MRYTLLISDYDGTLAADDGEVTGEDRAAIAEFRRRGGAFALASGRMFASIRLRAQALGLHGPVAACQGGMVADIDSGEALRVITMKSMDVIVQLREFERRGFTPHLYHGDGVYVSEEDEGVRRYELAEGVSGVRCGIPLSEYAAGRGLDAFKIVAVAGEEAVRAAYAELSAEYPHLLYAVSMPHLLEVMAPEANKAAGAQEIAARLGVPAERVAAIGDAVTDIPMLRAAGLGAAVANASQPVKDAASVVLKYTNNQHAVARFIREYLLKP